MSCVDVFDLAHLELDFGRILNRIERCWGRISTDQKPFEIWLNLFEWY